MGTTVAIIPPQVPATTDELTEGTVNLYDTGAPPTDSDDLAEGAVNKYVTAQQKSDFESEAAFYLAIPKLATAPVSPVEGEVYYDTVESKFMVYKDAAWAEGTFCVDVLPV